MTDHTTDLDTDSDRSFRRRSLDVEKSALDDVTSAVVGDGRNRLGRITGRWGRNRFPSSVDIWTHRSLHVRLHCTAYQKQQFSQRNLNFDNSPSVIILCHNLGTSKTHEAQAHIRANETSWYSTKRCVPQRIQQLPTSQLAYFPVSLGLLSFSCREELREFRFIWRFN